MKRLQGIAGAVLVIVILASTLGAAVFISNRDSAEDAVREYVEALRSGRAGRAVARLAEKPADTSLLNDAVLRDLNAAGRGITAIRSVSDHGATVELAHQEVRLDLPTVRDGVTWRIRNGVAKVSPHPSARVALRVEHGSAPADTWFLFPGVYQVSAASDALAVEPGTLRVAGFADMAFETQVTVKPEGQEVLRQRVSKALQDCAGRKEMAPAGCPWAWEQPRNAEVKTDSLTVTVPAVASPAAEFALQPDGTARADLDLPVKVAATAVMKSHAGEASFEQSHAVKTTAMVDMSHPDAVVVWAPR